MIKNHSITTRNYTVTYYQTLAEFHQKIAKIRDFEMLKTLLLPLEAMQ